MFARCFTDRTGARALRRAERLAYLPRVLAPLSFFALRAPRLLLPGLPYLALNLISVFPTAHEQYSHYLTPALPALLVAGIVGVTAVHARFLRALWFMTLGIAHVALGGSPLSRDFDRAAFREDAATRAARAVLAQIPPEESVQAPYPLLAPGRAPGYARPAPRGRPAYVIVEVSPASATRSARVSYATARPMLRALLAPDVARLLAYARPTACSLASRHAKRTLGAGAGRDAARSVRTNAAHSCLSEGTQRCAGATRLGPARERGVPRRPGAAFRSRPIPARVELLCAEVLSRPSARGRSGQWLPLSERGHQLAQRGLWVGAMRATGRPLTRGSPRRRYSCNRGE